MQTTPAVEQSKIIRWSESPWNQSGMKGKGLRKKRIWVPGLMTIKRWLLTTERLVRAALESTLTWQLFCQPCCLSSALAGSAVQIRRGTNSLRPSSPSERRQYWMSRLFIESPPICKVSKIWTISCDNSETVRHRISVTINQQ